MDIALSAVALLISGILTAKPVHQVSPSISANERIIAEHSISLDDRHENKTVNEVFKQNILLNLRYLAGQIHNKQINWEEVGKPFQFDLKLHPQESFAFHDNVLSQYQNFPVMTGTAHFDSQDGFKSDGYLVGDGVCHLASLIYWTAKDAGLTADAPTNHNFARIPDIPSEYGVSIYYYPGRYDSNAMQNLYITNNKDKDVTLAFIYTGKNLSLDIKEL